MKKITALAFAILITSTATLAHAFEPFTYSSWVGPEGATIFKSSNKKTILAVICLGAKGAETISLNYQSPEDTTRILTQGQCVTVYAEHIYISEDKDRRRANYTVTILESGGHL